MAASSPNGSAPPNARAVMERAIILKYLFVKALATPPREFLAACKKRWSKDEWNKFVGDERNRNLQLVERLNRSGLWNAMGEEECTFMKATSEEVTLQKQVDMSWRVESAVCLLWALGHVAELPPYDQQADAELTNQLPKESLSALLTKAALRPHETIEKQRDIAELWHWRSRTRQLQESKHKFALPAGATIEQIIEKASARATAGGLIPRSIGNDFPAFGKAYRDISAEEYTQSTSIAAERHRAFNWLCGCAPENRWAETPTDT